MHITCVQQSRAELSDLLARLQGAGIENLLALRGDPPKGEVRFTPTPGGFMHADELVAFIRKEGHPFCLGVAGYPDKHPEAPSPAQDLDRLKAKVEAGANFIVTQLFFDNAGYFRLVEEMHRRGVHVPVQPGIWLLTDYRQIEKILSLGVQLPPDFLAKLEKAREDPETLREIGIETATRQCADLLHQGAPGIHFYVMNKSAFALKVHANLKSMGLAH